MIPALSRRAAITLLALAAGGSRFARADIQPEADIETRILLLFRASDSGVQALLPEGWRSLPLPAGPGRGANLNLVFADYLLAQNTEGHAMAASAQPGVIVIVPARNAATGEAGAMVTTVFSPAGVLPGPDDPTVQAAISMKRVSEAEAGHPRRVQEQWNLSTADGGRLDLRLRYLAGPPSRVLQDQRVFSARHPDLARVWRVDQGVDTLRGAGIADRVEDLDITAKGARFAGLFDGSERLAAVISLPWYSRRAVPR